MGVAITTNSSTMLLTKDVSDAASVWEIAVPAATVTDASNACKLLMAAVASPSERSPPRSCELVRKGLRE